MATSGSIIYEYKKALFATDAPKLRLSWQKQTHSIENNTTTIAWQFELYFTKAATLTTQYKLEIDGKLYIDVNENMAVKKGWNTLKTGTQEIAHNNDGSKTFYYSFQETYDAAKPSASGSSTLDSLTRPVEIVSAEDFTDESKAKVVVAYPSGLENITYLDAAISLDGVKPILGWDSLPFLVSLSNEYALTLTEEEHNIIRRAITTGNSIPIYYLLRSTIGGATYVKSKQKTYRLVNYTPTLTPTVVDTNARTLELTGNNTNLIKYYSNALITFNAQGQKEATIVSRSVINGGQKVEIEDRGQDSTTINGVDSNTYYFTVVDSRGYSTQKAITTSFVPYVKLTNKLESTSLAADGSLVFKISGKYFSGSFGAKNNSLEVEYYVEDSSGNPVFNAANGGWVKLGTVSPTVDGTDYFYTYKITGLNYKETYKLTVNAIDELTPLQATTKVVSATPVFDWSKEDFHHHTDVIIDSGKNLYMDNKPLADFIIEQGNDGLYAYRKWNSGLMEAWRATTNSVSTAVATSYGNMYCSVNLQLTVNGGAAAFTTIEDVQLTILRGTTMGFCQPVLSNITLNNGGPVITYYITNPQKISTSTSFVPKVRIIGRWK